ncbi:MAG: hypothetical protein ACLP2F_01780 [Steroidobacteraceae bacterium]
MDSDSGHRKDRSQGGVTIDSWGMTGLVTDKAIAKYGSPASHGEVYTVVSQDGISSATQKAPNGFDWSQLIADFDSMGGSVSPPPSSVKHG